MNTLIFEIPRNQSVKQTESLLKQHLHLRKQVDCATNRIYLDTFDWLVYRDGGVLEAESDNAGMWITWRSLGADQIYGRYPINQIPRFVSDLKVTGFRNRLKQIVDVRALLPVVIISSRIHVFSILNRQEKTVLRIEIRSDSNPRRSSHGRKNSKLTLAKHVHVFPMKGYEKIASNICKVLQQECNLVPAASDPLVTLLEIVKSSPRIESKKPTVNEPDQRADVAAKSIFLQLLKTMEQNEDGMRKDIDSEFLHDFRVSVRRTRSLLDQMNNVLPSPRIARFSREFAWLGKVTGPPRDMDVYLLSFDSFKLMLPSGIRADLMPLYDFLGRHKITEHKRLIKALDSGHYRTLKNDWKNYLTAPPPKNTKLPHAERPIIDVAGKKIWRVYCKAIKQGTDIRPGAPATSLHQLRKTCKKLRYLNEFFQNLYPKKKVRELINSLKVLQDNLGEFQDLVVQQISLQQFILAMEEETGLTRETRHAMELLVFRLEQRNQQVRVEFAERFEKFSSPSNRKLYKQIYANQKRSDGDKQ
jgi:CHAD domain-containing protein